MLSGRPGDKAILYERQAGTAQERPFLGMQGAWNSYLYHARVAARDGPERT